MGKHSALTLTFGSFEHSRIIKFFVYHAVFGIVGNLLVIPGIVGLVVIVAVGIVPAVRVMAAVGVMPVIIVPVGIMRPVIIMPAVRVMAAVGIVTAVIAMTAVIIMPPVITVMIIAVAVINFPFRNRRQPRLGIHPVQELFHSARVSCHAAPPPSF